MFGGRAHAGVNVRPAVHIPLVPGAPGPVPPSATWTLAQVPGLGGFPQQLSWFKNPSANAGDARDSGSIPGLGRFPWRREWRLTAVFLPGESHGQRSLVGYSPRGCRESDMTETTWDTPLFSRSVVSDSLRPHGPQHARPPCPSPFPGVYPNSCLLTR